jgi:hypothetical protein
MASDGAGARASRLTKLGKSCKLQTLTQRRQTVVKGILAWKTFASAVGGQKKPQETAKDDFPIRGGINKAA